MLPIPHTEVHANDWLPPVPNGRQRAVEEVVRRLDPPRPKAPGPWVVGVAGPAGSGTSLVARRAARGVVERLRAEGALLPPRLLMVRLAGQRGLHGLATALLQRLDEGFDGRGFSVPEILAGFLRRVRREGRPTVLVLDDAGVGGPPFGPLLDAFADPDRFLPEGESGLPPCWTVVAGQTGALALAERSLLRPFAFAPFVELEPYSVEELRAIVRDRAERALGRRVSAEEVGPIVARAVEDGGGAPRAVALLRRRLLGVSAPGSLGPPGSRAFPSGVPVEPRVVRAIGAASGSGTARLGEVRRLEAELARAQGARPLPPTTLWRRIVHLERAGYVRREIRAGGNGGTLSLLRVLTPIDEWVTARRPAGTPPACAPWTDDGSWREAARPAAPRPEGWTFRDAGAAD